MSINKFDKAVNRIIDPVASVIAIILSLIFFPIVGIMKFYRSVKINSSEEISSLTINGLDKAGEVMLDRTSSFVLLMLRIIFLPFITLYRLVNRRSTKPTFSGAIKH